MKSPEKKKITVGLIVCWIFGIFFTLMSFGLFLSGTYISGTIVLLGSVMLIPFFGNLLENKLHMELSSGIKWVIAILVMIFFFSGMGNSVSETKFNPEPVNSVIGENAVVQEEKVQPIPSVPTVNTKTQYIQNNLKLEDVEVSEGYGQYDMPGYSSKRPTVRGKIRNTGSKSVGYVKIVVYFLDPNGKRIGEESYYPVNTDSIYGELLSEREPLKPNYVREWGYVVEEDAPPGWSKRVEVVISGIGFEEE